jgi:hypothetical protein
MADIDLPLSWRSGCVGRGMSSISNLDDFPTRPVGQRRRASVEVRLPVAWHCSGRPGYRLVGRMTIGRGQRGCCEEFAGAVVIEPVLARFEALQYGVARGLVVGGRVLAGRVIATTDVAASRAAAQVQPPARGRCRQALRATSSAGWHARVYLVRGACHSPKLRSCRPPPPAPRPDVANSGTCGQSSPRGATDRTGDGLRPGS